MKNKTIIIICCVAIAVGASFAVKNVIASDGNKNVSVVEEHDTENGLETTIKVETP